MELKKCPFCGRSSDRENYSYPCPTLGCLLNGFAVEPEHFELWNNRPIEDALHHKNSQRAKKIELLAERLKQERTKWKIRLN